MKHGSGTGLDVSDRRYPRAFLQALTHVVVIGHARFRLQRGTNTMPTETTARRRGCCIKPSRKTGAALAENHARAAMRDDLATDDMRVTNELAVFGAHP